MGDFTKAVASAIAEALLRQFPQQTNGGYLVSKEALLHVLSECATAQSDLAAARERIAELEGKRAALQGAALDIARIFHTSIWCRAPKSYRGSDWGDYLENEVSEPLDVLAKSMGAPMLDGVWYNREVKDPALKQHEELEAHLAALMARRGKP